MGTRGPPPKPVGLRQLQGTMEYAPMAARHGGLDPQVVPVNADPPAWLEGEAKDIWARFLPMMARLKLLTEADAETFATYCDVFARWLRVKRFLDTHQEGILPIYEPIFEEIRDDKGRVTGQRQTGQRLKYVQQLPQVSMYRNYMGMMLKYEQQFGLTPAARTGIAVGMGLANDADPVARYLFGNDRGSQLPFEVREETEIFGTDETETN